MAPISRKRHILDSLSEGVSNYSSSSGSVSDGDLTSNFEKRSPNQMSPSMTESAAAFFLDTTQFGHNMCSPIRSTSFSSTISSSSSTSNMNIEREDGNDSRSSLPQGTQFARVNRVVLDKASEEYRKRRERNNIAVKKSRTKSKLKSMETTQKVNLLKAENDYLSRKVDILSRELRLLKEIFMAHASNAHGTQITEYDLKLLTGSEMTLEQHHHHSHIASLPTSSPVPQCSSLSGMSGLHHLTAHRAALAQSRNSVTSPDSFSFFPGSRTFSPASLSSRSSAHDSEDDF